MADRSLRSRTPLSSASGPADPPIGGILPSSVPTLNMVAEELRSSLPTNRTTATRMSAEPVPRDLTRPSDRRRVPQGTDDEDGAPQLPPQDQFIQTKNQPRTKKTKKAAERPRVPERVDSPEPPRQTARGRHAHDEEDSDDEDNEPRPKRRAGPKTSQRYDQQLPRPDNSPASRMLHQQGRATTDTHSTMTQHAQVPQYVNPIQPAQVPQYVNPMQPAQVPQYAFPIQPVYANPMNFHNQRPTVQLQPFTGEGIATWLEDVQDVVFGSWRMTEQEWLSELPNHLGAIPKDYYRTNLKGLSWPEIAQEFKSVYNSKQHQGRKLRELEAIQQKPDENIAEFISRGQGLARHIMDAPQNRELRQILARGIRDDQVLTQFLLGADTPLAVLAEKLAKIETLDHEYSKARPGHKSAAKPLLGIKQVTEAEAPPQVQSIQQTYQNGAPTNYPNTQMSYPAGNNHRPPGLPTAYPAMTQGFQRPNLAPTSQGSGNTAACYNCGKPGHRAARCRARLFCTNCGRNFHTANTCRTPPTGVMLPPPEGALLFDDRDARPDNRPNPNYQPVGPNAALPTLGYQASPPQNPAVAPNMMKQIKGKHSDSMHLEVAVHGKKVQALFDTGADISTCHPDLLPPGQQYETGKATPLQVANQQLVQPIGIAWITITIGSEEYRQQFRVTPEFDTRMILGKDFMRNHTNCIHFQDNYIELNSGARHQCWRDGTHTPHIIEHITCQVRLAVNIPPAATMLVTFYPSQQPSLTTSGVIETISTKQSKSATAKQSRMRLSPIFVDLSNMESQVIPVTNCSTEPLLLKEGEIIAQFVPAAASNLSELTANCKIYVGEKEEKSDIWILVVSHDLRRLI